jgi:hypothetical protein
MVSWKQWVGSLVAIAIVGVIGFMIVSNQPPPPHFDDLRIDPNPEQANARSGPRLVVVSGETRQVRAIEHGRVEFDEVDERFGRGAYTATLIVPIELSEPTEAMIEVVFQGCTVVIRVGETVLGSGGVSPLTTERLSFERGVTDVVFEVTRTETAAGAFCSLAWVKSEARGPEPLPPFVN